MGRGKKKQTNKNKNPTVKCGLHPEMYTELDLALTGKLALSRSGQAG